jgi:hypothetical protein
VVGVDGHDFAYLFDLTTIAQPVRDQGRIAARLLLEQVNSSQPRPPSVVSVGSGLIRRGTTGPIGRPARAAADRKSAASADRKALRSRRSGNAAGAVSSGDATAAGPGTANGVVSDGYNSAGG